MLRNRCLLVLIMAGLVPVSISASSVAQQVPSSSSAAGIRLPETLKLSRLVDLTVEITGRSIVYNAAELEATVTLRVPTDIPRDDLPPLLFHILASRGFAVVRMAGSPVLTVVKVEQAAGASSIGVADERDSSPIRTDSSSPPYDQAGFVTEILTARHRTVKDLVEIARSVMSKPGGVVTPLGESGQLAISDFSGRMREIKSVLNSVDVPDLTITRQIKAKFVTAVQLSTLAQQVASKREAAGGRKLVGEVIPAADGTSVLLICSPESLSAWLGVLELVDLKESVETRTYTPRYFAASDVSKLVESVVGTTTEGGVADDRFRIVVDDLTGGLIITGTPTQHERVDSLMQRLDSAERAPTPVRSFPVRNRSVAELTGVLRELISSGAINSSSEPNQARAEVTAAASQSSPRPVPFTSSGLEANSAAKYVADKPSLAASPGSSTKTGQSPLLPASTSASGMPTPPRGALPLSITADEATNSIIAVGEPRLLSQLEALIQKLDVRQPQVMLEAMLVSLSNTEALTLGVEIEKLGKSGSIQYKLASLFGLSNGGPASGTVPLAGGFNSVVLDPGEFGVALKALESINKGSSLSNPRLLVTNNQAAVFSSVLQQPIQQQTRTNTTDTTFSYGGSESAGTTLSVRPQIAQGDHLSLSYSIKLSSFVGVSTTAGLPPPKQENAIDSVATVPDGHTIVVGGIELTTDSDAESRVPGLGQIPLLGELFKQRNNGKGKTKFYVFIRPTILRNSTFEDLKHLSSSMGRSAGIRDDDGLPPMLPRMIR